MGKVVLFFKIIAATFMALLTSIGGLFGAATQSDNVRMMAHRGYSFKYPENTALAFIEAAKHGAEGVETDLRITKDGVYVLNHNDYVVLDDGTKLTVAESTYEELTAKPLKNKKTKDEVYICAYTDFLDIMKEYGLEFYIEFKVECTEELVKDVFTMAEERYDISKCIFESPVFENCVLAREHFPEMPVMYVISEEGTDYSQCFEHNISVDVRYYAITDELLEDFHSRGLKVGAWTCDNVFNLSYAKSLGVDYIESNVFCE